MATTKGRTPTTARPRTTTRSSSTTKSSTASKPQSFVDTTTATVKKRPVATAAIATGALSAIAATVFGFFAWKKSGKSFSEFSGDIATTVKDKANETASRARDLADEATTYVKDGVNEATTKAKDFADRRKDGVDALPTQSEIAEEALSLKTVGETSPTFPTDPVIDSQNKTGAISY